jgi:NAD(P)-dependent dehydrogenase (short-subunit alcohol dehydrogenase family)
MSALVTGGASGIGAAVAQRLAARGHRVMVADVDDERGREVARAIGGVFVHADVSSPRDNERAVAAALEASGRLDVVVLNAGVPGRCGFDDFSAEHYRAVLGVNLDGVVHGIRASLAPMRAQTGGSIVVTSSLAGLSPSPDVFYSTAKHAQIGLVRSAAMLLAADGIRVNAVCPGLTDTALIASFRPRLVEAGLALAEPDEVAAAVETVLDGQGTGEAWIVQSGQTPVAVSFPDTAPAAVS